MRRDLLLLTEMLVACDRAIEVAASTDRISLESDWKSADALSWQFAVIGEAARQTSQETRDASPHVPWHKAVGLRNLITHEYWRIDSEILLTTATVDLPHLRS
jgi:uncharacterized protein with HEPN domain